MTWDVGNQPTLYQFPIGTRVTFQCSADSRRLNEETCGMVMCRFHWERDEGGMMRETDDNGGTWAKYTPESGQFDQSLSENQDCVKSYYYYDEVGSTTKLTDGTEGVTHAFTYDARGKRLDNGELPAVSNDNQKA